MYNRTKPQIYWMPAKHNEKTFEMLNETKRKVEADIESIKKECDERISERMRVYSERIDRNNHIGSEGKERDQDVKRNG
jgi:hypothetical protein